MKKNPPQLASATRTDLKAARRCCRSFQYRFLDLTGAVRGRRCHHDSRDARHIVQFFAGHLGLGARHVCAAESGERGCFHQLDDDDRRLATGSAYRAHDHQCRLRFVRVGICDSDDWNAARDLQPGHFRFVLCQYIFCVGRSIDAADSAARPSAEQQHCGIGVGTLCNVTGAIRCRRRHHHHRSPRLLAQPRADAGKITRHKINARVVVFWDDEVAALIAAAQIETPSSLSDLAAYLA